MSYLVAAPEFLASAATDLSNIGSSLNAAHAAAAAPTTGLIVGNGGNGGNAGFGTPDGTAGTGGTGGLLGFPGN